MSGRASDTTSRTHARHESQRERRTKRAPRDGERARRRDSTGLTDLDIHLFNEGTHDRLYDKLGAHVQPEASSVRFAVWAPNARHVSVIGDFNDWDPQRHPLQSRGESGIWEATVPDLGPGAKYKYHIVSQHNDHRVDKADPFAAFSETPPRTASIVHDPQHPWGDDEWMNTRSERQSLNAPISIYEVHLGSWARAPEQGNRWLTYREMADRLVQHVRERGFTHVELLPVMEHPFYGSWGYQATGYFAPTSRYGSPEDFMYLIDRLHQSDIGVILDWVPSHFPNDEHGLAYFDGTHLFEHADPRQGFHPDWQSAIFNYGRREVRAFLISSAMNWLDRYHIDGLRVDAVASMLYLDYSRREGEWVPNEHGGRENLHAISFLRQLNEAVHRAFPDVITIAEESTAWPMVSRPPSMGGLGFNYKWDMGWMHDTLRHFERDSVHRTWHHNELTFRGMYMFSENYVLSLSHDEVVHGKRSLLERMAPHVSPPDDWQKFANFRLLLGYMYTQPGKKLLFMGSEIAQRKEWNHDQSLDWHLLEMGPFHKGVQRWVEQLNRIYREVAALHALDCDPSGFEWLDPNDASHSVLTYMRRGRSREEVAIVACNMTPEPQHNYRVGAPLSGTWLEVLNSDATEFGGSGQGNMGSIEAAPIHYHRQRYALNLTIPPLGIVVLTPESRHSTKREEHKME